MRKGPHNFSAGRPLVPHSEELKAIDSPVRTSAETIDQAVDSLQADYSRPDRSLDE